MLELHNISKKFIVGADTIQLFDGFDFSVSKGEFVSIVGSNGSGKTTLLNLISGTLVADSGKIFLDGKDITKQKEHIRSAKIGRVFQNPSKGIANSMTVAENLSIAENKGKSYGLTRCLSKARFDHYKELVAPIGLGLENKLDAKMEVLSGGQRQAIALIMATMTPVDILILDEHTAALDPKTAEIIMQFTDKIVKEKELTTLMVTHNLRYAVEYGTRLVMMHEGKTVIDKAGEEKKNLKVDDILDIFNHISIECGN